jgi:diguanylate cyclase (GGDEF)-like protein
MKDNSSASCEKENMKDQTEYEHFRVLAEQVFLPVLILQNGMVKYINHAFCQLTDITNYGSKTISFKSLLKNIKNEKLRETLAQYKQCYYGTYYNEPIKLFTKNGAKWVELYRNSINLNGSEVDFISFLDVTGKINSEKEIRYLVFHDKLTGLYNRSFFEEEVRRIDNSRKFPISIIIADLNGLKLTNDVFGHLAGDKLLIRTADVCRKVCRKEDIISRWGGDEFAILLPETDRETAAKVCERIEEECNKQEKDPITLSVSLGYSTKYKSSESLNDVLKMAENMMYRRKLTESRRIRNIILNSLKESLFERSLESEDHIKRVVLLAKSFAGSLDMSDKELSELTLLSLLHDIGKVAIDEQILLKAGRLDKAEWAQVRTHSEKGYKIAINHQELAHISDGILCHHERWDGKGYPQGLTGNDIPGISRIFSIVDAYDIMTHETVYKSAVSHDDALAEINRCSGKQFDPFYASAFTDFMQKT